MFRIDHQLNVPAFSAWCDACGFNVVICRLVSPAERTPQNPKMFYVLVDGRGLRSLEAIKLQEKEVLEHLIGQGWTIEKRGTKEFLFCDQCSPEAATTAKADEETRTDSAL